MIITLEHGGAGVYLLQLAGVVIYVGRSHHVPSRLAGHKKKEYDSVEIIFCPLAESYELERKLIQKYQPALNKQNKAIKVAIVKLKASTKEAGARCSAGAIPKTLKAKLVAAATEYKKTLDHMTEAALELFFSLPESEREKLLAPFPNKIFGRPL